MIDSLSLVKTPEIKCLDKGLVKIVDVMPRLVPEGQTCDSAIVQMARVSYGEGTKTPSDDKTLIRYLMRHRHSSPIESVEFKFHICAPIFILRQVLRHRTASLNEESARYSVVKDKFQSFTPQELRAQSKDNKQSSSGEIDKEVTEKFTEEAKYLTSRAYSSYLDGVKSGISREQARTILPQSMYSELYYKIDLHNLLHFMALRMDSHAQEETREYANAFYAIVSKLCPIAVQAFDDYNPMRNAMLLTALDITAMRSGPLPENKRELREFLSKMERLGNEKQISRAKKVIDAGKL